jgi:hypothetical protein
LGISWNTHVAKRADAAAVLAASGLVVLDDGPYLRFEHRVDQAITRDILVGTRTDRSERSGGESGTDRSV